MRIEYNASLETDDLSLHKPPEQNDKERTAGLGCAIAVVLVLSPVYVLGELITSPVYGAQVRLQVMVLMSGDGRRARPQKQRKSLKQIGKERRRARDRKIDQRGR